MVAMVSQVDAVSGGRTPRTRSDSTRIPGQVVSERALRGLKATGSRRVFPGARGKVDSAPGEAVLGGEVPSRRATSARL